MLLDKDPLEDQRTRGAAASNVTTNPQLQNSRARGFLCQQREGNGQCVVAQNVASKQLCRHFSNCTSIACDPRGSSATI